jgi:hypothetical protein
MSKPNPADLPGSMVILGLLIEQPGQTVGEVAEQLRTRFASCRFDPATASHTLDQMARSARARSPRVYRTFTSPGRGCRLDRYEVTVTGIRGFQAWMYQRPTGVPALREALYGRIELCRLEDLPELIRIAKEEVSIADDQYARSKATLTNHLQRGRRRPKAREPEPADFLREVRNVLVRVTPGFWSARSMHYDEIAEALRDIATRAGIDVGAES